MWDARRVVRGLTTTGVLAVGIAPGCTCNACNEMRAPLEKAFEKSFLSGIQACVDFFEQRGNAGRGSVRDMTVARVLGAVKHQYRGAFAAKRRKR